MSTPEGEPSSSTTTPKPSRSQSTAQSSSSGRPPPEVPEKITLSKPAFGYSWGSTIGGRVKPPTILPESLTNPKGKRKAPDGEEPTAADTPALAPEPSLTSPVSRDDPPHQSTGDPTQDILWSTKPNTGNPEQESCS